MDMSKTTDISRHFMVFFDNFPISKSTVRTGNNSSEVVTACRSINVGLFLSGNLRRNTSVSIAYPCEENIACITFPGNTLRRVSPDERSISFFLLKAQKSLGDFKDGYRIMDNGIILMHSPFDVVLNLMAIENVHIAEQKYEPNPNYRVSDKGIFVYLMSEDLKRITDNFSSIPHPPTPERLILDLNMYFDSMP
ncbi:MAG: hypothetical protein GF411_06920 [Candidatus Lokiarchaeota archaeon]|nr:hypothetical protein [Candidatus Lokiarchaeota archaeon]